MAKAKVFTGARAIVKVDNVPIAIFDSCSYAVNVGAEAIHILGRYSPAEIAQTSYEAVTVNCSGFRIIGDGDGNVHNKAKMVTLKGLISLEGVTLSMVDRQDNSKSIMEVRNCIPISYSTGANAKATSRIQITYMGTAHNDEATSGNDEGDGAVNLP